MARLFLPFFQAIDGNGAPISGAKLYFYVTGTTTPKNTYSQSDLDPSHVNSNPVVADSNGRFGAIYLAQDADYKAILKDASDVSILTLDPLLAIQSSVISHQGSLIVGGPLGQDTELLIGAANTSLRSDGTTAEWRAPNATVQRFTSGSGTYSRPANCTAIKVRMIGGGGGGAGCGQSTAPNGSDGGTSSFNSITAVGGFGGKGSTSVSSTTPAGGLPGTGGSGTTGVILRLDGSGGLAGMNTASNGSVASGNGGSGPFGGAGNGRAAPNGAAGLAGGTGTGSGGGGAGGVGSVQVAGGGGGSGEYVEILIVAPSATYSYAVGGGGAGGIGTGTGAFTGGAGGSGIVIVEEFYG